MAYGHPKRFPDYIDTAANAEAEQAFPTTEPRFIPPPDARLGPIRFNGGGLDSAALAVLNTLQNQQMPGGGNFGTGLLTGLAGGLAGGRVRQMQSRQAANAGEQKRVEREAEYRRRMVSDSARQMRGHQLGMIRDAAKKTTTTPKVNEAYIHLDTPEKVAAFEQQYPHMRGKVPADGIVSRSSIFERRDPVLDEISRLRADQLKREGDAQESAINQTVDDIVNFRTDPTRIARDKNFRVIESKANESLRAAGSPYTLQQLQTMWNEKERFYKTADNQRFTGFRQAAYTVNQHIRQFENLYSKYADRAKNIKDIRAANKSLYTLAKEGWLGSDAQADAIDLDVIAEILPKEIATVVAGGRAPYEKEISHADAKYVTPFLRRKASAAQISSIRSVLKARIEAQQKALPFAGGKKNPYLIEVSGIDGWDEAEKETPVAGEKKKSEADLFNERK